MIGTDISGLSLLLLGLLGTGHCLGMCGPLVAALPGAYGHWAAHLFYHTGRLLTYTLCGAALGAVGGWVVGLGDLNGGAALIWTARIQTAVSVLAALCLIWLGTTHLGLIREPRWMAQIAPRNIPGYGPALRKSLNRHNSLWLFVMGLMLGLLPCGLSYAAFARALAAGDMISGAGLALMFGLGTLPGLLALGTGIGRLWRRFQAQTDMVAGLIMIGMALGLVAEAWTAVF